MTSPRRDLARIRAAKGSRVLACATALDAPTAWWCDEAGIDLVLVGDSLGMVSFGLPDTTTVSMPMMVAATAAAARGLHTPDPPLLVADIPLEGLVRPVESARSLLDSGADAVKVECHAEGAPAMNEILAAGIPVMAHVGLMPQEVQKIGGYRLQGTTVDSENAIRVTAAAAQTAGAFSIVLEKIPASLAEALTRDLSIPTIGIGAGPHCDGQILVLYDLLGIFDRFRPKFVRRYAELGQDAVNALKRYARDVRSGTFPSEEESF